MRLVGRWLRILWMPLLLAGCAAPSFESDGLKVIEQRQGRFSIQTQSLNQPPDATQGSFVWRKLARGWQLDLNTPLGATLARLTITPMGATLEQPDASTRRAESGQALLSEILGAPVPLDALEDWIEGRVRDDGTITDMVRDSEGRVVSFKQLGWQVGFDRYGHSGPARITVKGRQLDQDIDLRLVIEQPAQRGG